MSRTVLKYFRILISRGGVVITFYNKKWNYTPIKVFTQFESLNNILQKVLSFPNHSSITNLIFIQNRLNLANLYSDHPEYKTVIGSDGRDSRFEKNIFSKLSEIFSSFGSATDIKTIGIHNNKRSWRYIDQKYVDLSHENLFKYKIIIPVASGSGKFGQELSTPIIENPQEAYTRSFIGIGAFSYIEEATAALKYIKSKFARAMLSVLKVTQMCNKDVWEYVPLQDFTNQSDIDWSASIPNIDRQLYKKYGLSQDEIEFIETHVKEME